MTYSQISKMFLGNNVFLYVVLCGCITLALVAASILHPGQTMRYGWQLFWNVEPRNGPMESKAGSYYWAMAIATAMGVISTVYATQFYSDTQKNFKNIMLFSTYCIFFIWMVMDLIGHFTLAGKQWAAQYGLENKGAESMWYKFVNHGRYVFAHLAIFTYMCIMIACLFSFNSAAGVTVQATSQIQLLSPFLCGGVIVICFMLMTRTYYFGQVYEPGTIQKILDSSLKVSGSSFGAALKKTTEYGTSMLPLQFGPTGDKLHDPTLPENRVLLEIDRKVKAEGAKYGLSLKDYKVVAMDNNFYAMKPEDAAVLLKQNPTAAVHFPKYGLMALEGVVRLKKGQEEGVVLQDNKVKEKVTKMYTPGVSETSDKNVMPFLTSARKEIVPSFAYTHNIMGFGIGNGTWVNLPWWLLLLIFMVELAVYSQVMGDSGTALAILFVTSLGPIIVGLAGVENGSFQIFAYGKVVGWGVLLLANQVLPGNPSYIFKDAIMETTTYWLQYPAYISPAEAVEVPIFGWTAFANCVAYMISASMVLVASSAVANPSKS